MTDASDRRGSWSAFEAEVLPHIDALYRLAVWFERNREEAEDLVQETLTSALTSFHRFRSGTNCRAWLVSILRHVRSNRRRGKQRSPLVSDPDERLAGAVAFVPPVPERLTDEDMLGALERIPPSYQEVVLLSDVEGLTYKEISSALSIPLGTVMSRLHRARALLRQELAAFGDHSQRSLSLGGPSTK